MNASTDLTTLAMSALAGPASAMSASELHGVVIGIAVCNIEGFSMQSLVDLLGVEALSSEDDVVAFVRESLEQLLAEDMTFAALLPDDDADLSVRLEALADWTSGFLAGLAEGLNERGLALDALPEEVQEIISDFAAIAEVEADAEDPEGETDFLQLQEFVKVGALLILSLSGDDDVDPSE